VPGAPSVAEVPGVAEVPTLPGVTNVGRPSPGLTNVGRPLPGVTNVGRPLPGVTNVDGPLPDVTNVGRPFQGRRWLVANGWIYPTDSSINVAIGQQHLQPHGLSLEAEDDHGRWRVIAADLGFPAGKNKTILIDLAPIARAGITHPRRIRLRTNLEVYWDQLALADDVPRVAGGAAARTVKIAAQSAELRFRGFSKTDHARRDMPETPRYDEVANVAQRWRDLIGYYTKFGDVRELVSAVDDRYVIMNAGD